MPLIGKVLVQENAVAGNAISATKIAANFICAVLIGWQVKSNTTLSIVLPCALCTVMENARSKGNG